MNVNEEAPNHSRKLRKKKLVDQCYNSLMLFFGVYNKDCKEDKRPCNRDVHDKAKPCFASPNNCRSHNGWTVIINAESIFNYATFGPSHYWVESITLRSL